MTDIEVTPRAVLCIGLFVLWFFLMVFIKQYIDPYIMPFVLVPSIGLTSLSIYLLAPKRHKEEVT